MGNKHLTVAPLPTKASESKSFRGLGNLIDKFSCHFEHSRHSQKREARHENPKRAAFTLAEAIVVLVVLGLVAAMTIPTVVRHQIEASNRTKIKKTMKVFDLLLNRIALENDIKSTSALKEWGEKEDENGNACVNQRKYFKAVKGEGCQFMTADKVWWDVTDITHPIISLKEGELNKPNSKTTFQLLGHFGPNGELRISDIQWEISNNDNLTFYEKKALEKLYNYVNNKTTPIEPRYTINRDLWGSFKNERLCTDTIQTSCIRPVMLDGRAFGGSSNVYTLVLFYIDGNGNIIVSGYGCKADRSCYLENNAIADGNGGYITLAIQGDDGAYHDSEEYRDFYTNIVTDESDLTVNEDLKGYMNVYNKYTAEWIYLQLYGNS